MSGEPRVIVVDDEPEMLAAIRRALTGMPIELRTTTEGPQALAWVANGDVALVISDYNMPIMSGIEVVAEVRRRSPSTVRVLMTGNRELHVAVDGINRGEVFRYVQKPLDAVQIRMLVVDAIARHRELAATAADRAHAIQTELVYRALEDEHPGIRAVQRADDGTYVVPTTCAADALGLLGLSPTLVVSPVVTPVVSPTLTPVAPARDDHTSEVGTIARHDLCSRLGYE